jgi:hypothetical protein
VLLLCVEPKPAPVIVTELPIGPDAGEMPVIVADSITLNCTPLLVTPPTVTVTGPLVALFGTATVTLVLLQEEALAASPLKKIWLLLWLEPKSVPVTMTVPPTGAAGGLKLEMTGLMNAAVELTATLSKVAVVIAEADELVTAKPTNTLVAIAMACVDPSCVQFTASGAV